MSLDVLIVAPHPDDAELGMGGTIVRMIADGWSVGVLDLTNGEPTPRGSPEIRARETAAATKILGISWRENLGLPNRSLEPTLAARAALAGVIRTTKPRWLFAPYWVDAHPDHVAATQLIEAAKFWSKLTKTDLPGTPHQPQRLLYYYCVHLNVVIEPALVVDVTDHWPAKQAALECYHSQFLAGRPSGEPTVIDRMRTMAAYWGQSIGVTYGEPLASREPIGVRRLDGLI
jgi:bacillithiol biosynthesis deacetylase BshB1